MDWHIELTQYIARCLKLGFAESEILAALRSVGWRDEQTRDAFAVARDRGPRLIGSARLLRVPLLPAGNAALRLFAPRRATASSQQRRVPMLLPPPRPARESVLAAGAAVPPLLLDAPPFVHRAQRALRGGIDRFFNAVEKVFATVGRIVLVPFALAALARGAFAAVAHALAAQFPPRKTVPAAVSSALPSLPRLLPLPEHILLRDVFRLAGRMFRARRLRTFLTILGTSVGIGTILFLVALGYGLQNVLFERITTEEALATLDVVAPADADFVRIDDGARAAIAGISGVVETSAMTAFNGDITAGEFSAAGTVYAADEGYLRLAAARAVVGTLAVAERSVVISSAAAKLLGWEMPNDALGKELTFVLAVPEKESIAAATVALPETYKISGVMDDQFSVFAYVPAASLRGISPPPYSQLKVKVADIQQLAGVRDQILSRGLLVFALSETVDQAKKVFNIVKIVLGLFGVITLVVSAIGMLNTMTIALLERTQEVGVMKAIGASNFDIWKLFLAEAVIMGFLGGIGGIIIGFGTAEAFNYGINLLAQAFGGQSLNFFQAPSWFIITIVAFSAAVGLITGLWPARRAARLDPLDALKYK